MTKSKPPGMVSEFPHEPHYDIRIASQSYSNIAAVLAGFAFAAVVLVVQTDLPPTTPNADTFRDWATIYFLLAFAGCVSSAFLLAMLTGEEVIAARSHTIALLAGTGFSVSVNLIFLGLAALVEIFLSQRIRAFSYMVFPLLMSLSPLLVVFSAFDPIIQFDHRLPTKREMAQALVPSFAPLLIILLMRYLGVSFSIALSEQLFGVIMAAALAIILLGACSAIVVSVFAKHELRLNPLWSGVWVGIHSLVIGLFIFML